jgi:hypothetical protein
MPDPITSSVSSRRERTDDDPTCRMPLGPTLPPLADEPGAGGACALDVDWASHDAVQASVDYSRVEVRVPVPGNGAPETIHDMGDPPYKDGPAFDNARRTAAREASPYADAGVTRYGTAVFCGIAADKGTAYDGKTSREVLSASAQLGVETEVQAAVVRGGLSVADGNVTASVDVGTVKANLGVLNGDGSYGLNAGAVATIASAEVTIGVGGYSLTAGVGAGAGLEASAGLRDADGDGRSELCVRFGGAFGGKVVLGTCIERFFF